MASGKAISLFLIDGTPDGIIACEILNWTGKGYRIPKNKLKNASDRSELKKAGIYFLIGRDENDNECVYIGESEEVLKRIFQHQEKDFWSEALAFISKDENLNKAHVKFLEYRLYIQAKDAKRYKIINDNTPTEPAISEADQAVMLEFSKNLQLLVGTMGYKIFEKLIESNHSNQDRYYISATRGAHAEGMITSEGFVVLKNSKIATTEVPSITISFKNKRNKLTSEGIIKDWIFTQDYLFSSPSTAAAIVMGRNANGLAEWKKKDGSTINDNLAKEE
ncbi:MAG: methionine sulfoxide reductase [Elusimicrobia bacterium RIFOXYD2_FULL_34_15]|nr:MAG: methionine sulfoxide reductase [Elusimicrobia bacterium RIFOXYD2_FULL_34_15]